MARDVILAADLGGEVLSSDELAAIPDFSSIRKEIWDKFPGAIVRKQYAPGQLLMAEGEYGVTAFYLVSGTVEIYIHNPVSRVESHRRKGGGLFGGFRKFTNYIKGVPPGRDGQQDTGRRTHIPIDAPV